MSQSSQCDADGRTEKPQQLMAQKEGYDSPKDLQVVASPTHPSGLLSPPAQVDPITDENTQSSFVGAGVMLGNVPSDQQSVLEFDVLELEEFFRQSNQHSFSLVVGAPLHSSADATVMRDSDTDSGCCRSCVVM